jgi:biopolymer transport protein ExbB
MTVLSTLLLAQAADPPVVAGAKIESVWDFVLKGGPTMIVIGLCSLVALAVIVERLIVLRRRYVIPDVFVTSLRSVANDRSRALDLCTSNDSPIARILSVAIRRRGQSSEAIEKAVSDAGTREMVRLRHRMRLLSALPQVSTMLGLLGTIFGMIKTFQAVAASGQSLGKTELLAKGIFEAWTCTAAGLLVAIPVLIAYHALMGRIDALAVEMDRVATDWVERETGVAAPHSPKTTDVATASGSTSPALASSSLQPAAGG